MSSISESPLIRSSKLEELIQASRSTKVLQLTGYRFDHETFGSIIAYLSQSTELTHMHFSKQLLDRDQADRILQITNGNLMKGVKLLDEGDILFGNAYTDWHAYNEEKKDVCKLHKTTTEALKNFPSPPTHVIDFGAGTGQETIVLLVRGCKSVVAIVHQIGDTPAHLKKMTKNWSDS